MSLPDEPIEPIEPSDRVVEERARELLHGGRESPSPVATDHVTAARAARGILEESVERTADPATGDPEDGSVIRRTSEESAGP